MTTQEEQIRKIAALQRMCSVLSKRFIDDIALASMVEAFSEVSADQLEDAVDWSIRNETTLPAPALILERIESGHYRTTERIEIKLTEEERIKSFWKEDMNDCGISDPEVYKLYISRWEKENPGLSYFDEIVKRRY